MNEARAAKLGEKKLLILQTIAEMLERPAADKVTTALAGKAASGVGSSALSSFRQQGADV
jgi:hypothetical protein